MAFVIFELTRQSKPTAVFVVTNPPLLPHLAWLYGRLRGVPYVVLVWDIYPDHAVEQGWLSEAGLLARTWRSANRRSLRAASGVITIGERMASKLREQAGDIRIDVIPNWADVDVIRPVRKESNSFAAEHGQTGCITVLYSGNVGRTHGLSTLIQAASLLRDVPETHFLVIGDGLGLESARRLVVELDIPNISFLPLQPWSVLPLSLATGDIAVVLQAPGTENLSVPSKTYNFLAAGCAIAACTVPGSDLAVLVETHGVGFAVTSGDSHALATSLRSLIGAPELLSDMRNNARKCAVESFSFGAIQSSFKNVFQRSIGNRRR